MGDATDHTHDLALDPLELDTTRADAVRGVLQMANGGTGRDDAMALGTTFDAFIVSASDVPFGAVVRRHPSGAIPTTAAGATDVLGAVCDRGGIPAYGTGRIQVGGVAWVLTTGVVNAGDRLATSGMTSRAQSSTATGTFARALTFDDGTTGGVWAHLSEFADAASIDHGALAGLGDDDHPHYLLRREIRRGPNRLAGIAPTGYYDPAPAFGGGWTNLAGATDADPNSAAVWGDAVYAAGTLYVGLRFDLTTPKVLSLLVMTILLAGDPNGATEWGHDFRVRFSDDGSTWTTLDTLQPVWVSLGSNRWYMATTFLQTAARYWECAFVKVQGSLGFTNGISIYDVTWQEDTSDGHTLLSDQHRDVDVASAPTNGQVLAFDSASRLWRPSAPGLVDPTTTKGDLIVHGSSTTRLAVGTDGQVLTADAAQATGVKWAAAAPHDDHQHIGQVMFSGDGTTTSFELPAAPFDAHSVAAFVAGTRTSVTLSGGLLTTMTFATPPASGADNITVDIVATVA